MTIIFSTLFSPLDDGNELQGNSNPINMFQLVDLSLVGSILGTSASVTERHKQAESNQKMI